jgi:lipoprotein-releasing system ATP-binding protein
MSAKNLHKTYYKNNLPIPVLKGINLDLIEGERVAVMGSSGAGKSTLLHILGTLDQPDQGEMIYHPSGQVISKLSNYGLSEFRNKVLGFVFQFHYLLPEFSAIENVMMPSFIAHQPKDEVSEHAVELLKYVGLAHRLEHRPSELSGGEQQRVAIARSLMNQPKILLADELTGNLDRANGEHVMELLVDLNQSKGVTILLITHDAVIASKMQRTLLMQDGQFV